MNNAPAPAGTVVSAKINGATAGSYTTTVSGQYGSLAERDYLAVSNASATDGDTITFYVSGISTGQTAAFEVGGGPTRLDLNLTVEGGGAGGGAAPAAPAPTTVPVTVFGSTSSFSISSTGEIQETFTATSDDGNLTMTIPEGTIALDKDGDPLGSLTAAVDPSPPSAPENANIIGAFDFGPPGATFDPAITFIWTYDPDALPEGVAEEDLVIAYYDEDAGEWVDLPCTVDPVTHTVTAAVSHFTTFAIIATIPVPAPAAFTTSSLAISPAEVAPGEMVTISVSVANTGGMEGSYTAVLKINGVKEADKSVTVDVGTSQRVTFTATEKEAGKYLVAVNGLSGSFTVVAPVVVAPLPKPPAPAPAPAPAPPTPPPAKGINWPVLSGFIAGAVVLIVVVVLLATRRRRY